MNSNTKKVIFIFSLAISSLLLKACGGGGTEEKETILQAQPIEVQPPKVIEEEEKEEVKELPAEPKITMATLVANEGFTFDKKNEISVNINLSEYKNDRSYLSIYKQYHQMQNGTFFPIAHGRVLAGSLNNGLFKQTFIADEEHSIYLIELWFYDGRSPIQQELTVMNNELIW